MSTETKHTKEPWMLMPCPHVNDTAWIIGANGKKVTMVDAEYCGNNSDTADLRRIVACVNACVGIDTGNLECIALSLSPLTHEELQASFEASQSRAADRISSLEAQLVQLSGKTGYCEQCERLGRENKELVYDRAHMDSLRKENAELYGKNKELRERVDAFLDSLRDESLPDWAARKIYEFDKALSGGG
jgi:hypothetical protein